MAAVTYTVVKGDTLIAIARKYNDTYHYGSNEVEAYKKLAAINDIDNPNYIVVGQVIKLTDDSGGTTPAPPTQSGKQAVTIKAFGLQSNADRTLYASWAWTNSHTKEYRCIWQYDSGDGMWFEGSNSTTTSKQSLYNAPTNAKRVRFKVKPISKTHKVDKKDTSYWLGKYTTYKYHDFTKDAPSKASTPTATLDSKNKFQLTVMLENIDANWNATSVFFEVVYANSLKRVYSGTGKVNKSKRKVSFVFTVNPGRTYKVRCRGINNNKNGEWSDYSSDIITPPSMPAKWVKIRALSETSVYLDWSNVSNCTSYEIQYTQQRRYFDSNPAEVKSQTVESVVGHAEITGLESGNKYYFRVRAINSAGESGWLGPSDPIIIGKTPSAPTTWSSTTTVMVGEVLNLYWVHNSEDGSSQESAQLELTIGSGQPTITTIPNTATGDDKDKTSVYSINTSAYAQGTEIKWRVRTAGITNAYGEWSVLRTVNVYAPVSLSTTIEDQNGNTLDTINSFPFYLKAQAGPNTQTPISYHVAVIAKETYSTVDQVGDEIIVAAGSVIYSKLFNTKLPLTVEFSAGNIDLENNVAYSVTTAVSMNTGLRAEDTIDFDVAWVENEYDPNAEFSEYDTETGSIIMRPYCTDIDDNLVDDVTLSVYRKSHDGEFIEIASNIPNTDTTYITDPHPSLDYARYRIVATSKTTGAVSYYDCPGQPIGEHAAIIQWDEEWSNLTISEVDEGDSPDQPIRSGSLLRLPYNVDVSDKATPDVALVKYIGRKRPVSYYGTQLGESSSWKVDIEKDDKDTLYALRKLAIWCGDVYVREPSGSGYWASINVSFSQTHCEVTIPVTLEITRVEGGM